MKRRTRTLAGLLAFVALTASLSEAVVASFCTSGAGMETMPAMATSMENEGDASPLGHGMACGGMGHADEPGHRSATCPLTPTSAQGCTTAASAPASTMSVHAGTTVRARYVAIDIEETELLLADALYDPPRA